VVASRLDPSIAFIRSSDGIDGQIDWLVYVSTACGTDVDHALVCCCALNRQKRVNRQASADTRQSEDAHLVDVTRPCSSFAFRPIRDASDVILMPSQLFVRATVPRALVYRTSEEFDDCARLLENILHVQGNSTSMLFLARFSSSRQGYSNKESRRDVDSSAINERTRTNRATRPKTNTTTDKSLVFQTGEWRRSIVGRSDVSSPFDGICRRYPANSSETCGNGGNSDDAGSCVNVRRATNNESRRRSRFERDRDSLQKTSPSTITTKKTSARHSPHVTSRDRLCAGRAKTRRSSSCNATAANERRRAARRQLIEHLARIRIFSQRTEPSQVEGERHGSPLFSRRHRLLVQDVRWPLTTLWRQFGSCLSATISSLNGNFLDPGRSRSINDELARLHK
jgi:hypothetical protein